MNSAAILIFSLASLIGSVAALLSQIAKLWAAAKSSRKLAANQTPVEKKGRGLDLFFVVIGMLVMFSGIAYFIWALSRPDGPVTEHQVITATLCAANIVTGNLILVTTTIKQYVA